jgi:hypothetical protein
MAGSTGATRHDFCNVEVVISGTELVANCAEIRVIWSVTTQATTRDVRPEDQEERCEATSSVQQVWRSVTRQATERSLQ